MGRPYTIPKLKDLAIGASDDNILSGLGEATLKEDSVVLVYALRESVDVTFQITVGSDQVFRAAGCSLQAAVGNYPSTKDNLVVATIGSAGDEIQINASNANAAAQEIAVLVIVVPESIALQFPQFMAAVS